MTNHSVGQGTLVNGGHANFTQTFNNNYLGITPQRTLLQALKFPSSGLHEQLVKPRCHGTCEWFLETAEYRNWIESEEVGGHTQRMLWLLGKAGSGKSTLMKFTIEQTRIHAARSDLLLTHFFNARGTMLEKSVEGMYRTLLAQILDKLEYLSGALLEETTGWMPCEGGSWPIPTLLVLLKGAIRMLEGRRLVFFVDALDECDNEDAQEMVEGFESLIEDAASNGQRFRVCFASRPYPAFATYFAEYFRLDSLKSHEYDIKKYIETHLRIGQSSARHAVEHRADTKQQLLLKSNHVFLWAELVINLLNKDYRDGKPERYKRWLEGNLGDLDKLYMGMWQQDDSFYDEQDKREQILCFQWTLYHSGYYGFVNNYDRFLAPRQLWWGVQLGLGKDVEDIFQRSAELDDETIERFIISRSKGLIEVSKHPTIGGAIIDRNGTVSLEAVTYMTFIHESAREFVVGDKGPLKQFAGAHLEVQGHLQLKDCYESFLEHYRLHLTKPGLSRDTAGTSQDISRRAQKAQFFRSARFSIFQHANAIHRLSTDAANDQGEWAVRFHTRYKSLSRLFVERTTAKEVSLFSILVRYGLVALMQATSQLLFKEAFDARNCRYVPGVSNSLSDHRIMRTILEGRNVEAIRIIVEIYYEVETRHSLVNDILIGLAAKGSASGWEHSRIGRMECTFGNLPPLLVASFSDELATFLLIALIPASATFSDHAAKALHRAADGGYISTLNHVIRNNIPTRFFQLDKLTDSDKVALKNWAVQGRERERELAAALAALRTGESSYRGFIPQEPS